MSRIEDRTSVLEHAGGEADVSRYRAGKLAGEGAGWSPDRQRAVLLSDGEVVRTLEAATPCLKHRVPKKTISQYDLSEPVSCMGGGVPPSPGKFVF